MISVNTEITDNNVNVGQVLYDGECAFCLGWARRGAGLLRRAGFELATLQQEDPVGNLSELVVRMRDGRRYGGADGVVQIARHLWWSWPLYAFAQIPGVRPLLRAGYRRLAADRHCLGGACARPENRHLTDGLPLFLLPVAAFLLRDAVPDWVFMWVLAWTIFFGCKWLTWRRACRELGAASRGMAIQYLFGWVGMDAKPFWRAERSARPTIRAWLRAGSQTAAGFALVGFAVWVRPEANPLVTGWVGMLGIILSLHFGLFEVLALVWQRAGVPVEPLMRAPLCATSLGDFWGRRWNTGFHRLAHQWAFRPLARRFGMAWATMGVFLASGLIHDLVISVPARGGYGWPTAYFVLQGAAILFERSTVGRALGLARGLCGRAFAILLTAGPAFGLFHPIFVHHVILPMLQAFGAT